MIVLIRELSKGDLVIENNNTIILVLDNDSIADTDVYGNEERKFHLSYIEWLPSGKVERERPTEGRYESPGDHQFSSDCVRHIRRSHDR